MLQLLAMMVQAECRLACAPGFGGQQLTCLDLSCYACRSLDSQTYLL